MDLFAKELTRLRLRVLPNLAQALLKNGRIVHAITDTKRPTSRRCCSALDRTFGARQQSIDECESAWAGSPVLLSGDSHEPHLCSALEHSAGAARPAAQLRAVPAVPAHDHQGRRVRYRTRA